MAIGGFKIQATNSGGGPISDDLVDAQKSLASLASEMPNVAVRAINKTLTGTKTEMSQALQSVYNFKAAEINKRLTIQRAKIQSMGGYVRSKGGQFHLTDITGTRQLKKGVKVKIKKDSGGTTIPRAFIAPGINSGKLIVFRRPKMSSGKLYPRYGKPGSGGLHTIKRGLKGRDARLEWFMVMHPEYLYNTQIVWKKIDGGVKIRVDTNIERELEAEIRRINGQWGSK